MLKALALGTMVNGTREIYTNTNTGSTTSINEIITRANKTGPFAFLSLMSEGLYPLPVMVTNFSLAEVK
jgi:hypothetical protein